jgi:septum formation protein
LKERQLPLAPVLCSDTTVALGREILGKPQDHQDAKRMLRQLSGQSHRVLTAVALGTARKRLANLSVSHVRFTNLSQNQIQQYVSTDEPMGKAGAYAVQGRASSFIEHMSGSYSGIMGLPMYETAQILREWGFKI